MANKTRIVPYHEKASVVSSKIKLPNKAAKMKRLKMMGAISERDVLVRAAISRNLLSSMMLLIISNEYISLIVGVFQLKNVKGISKGIATKKV